MDFVGVIDVGHCAAVEDKTRSSALATAATRVDVESRDMSIFANVAFRQSIAREKERSSATSNISGEGQCCRG